MNIRLLKKLDAVLGYMSTSLLPLPVCRETSSPLTNILIIRPGGIGDAVLLAPAIHFLKKAYPTIHITVQVEKRNVGIFQLIPGIDRILCYDCPGEFLQTLCCNYNVVIDTEQWHRLSAVVTRLISAPVKIGFDTNERRRMFTHQMPFSHDDYEVVSFTHLLEPLGIETCGAEITTSFLSIPDDVTRKTTSLLEALCDGSFVIIFPGASIAERRWGANRFRRVAEMLKSLGFAVVVVGGEDDLLAGEEICAGNFGLNLAGQTSLAETAAVIQKSALLISGDSGVLHIAVGLDIPTVSLFGPGRAKKWAPRGERHIVINKELPCSPCTTFGNTPPCPINAKCMSDITVEEVFEAVTTLLTRTGSIFTETLKKSE